MYDLNGKIAVVTGASAGIGKAVALALADAGADVALIGRDEARLASVAESIIAKGRRAMPLVTELADVSAIAPAFASIAADLGPVDILVNNAGINKTEPAVTVTPETWDRIQAVNVRAPFFCAQAVAPGMLARGSGKIIFIASDAGVRGFAEHATYGTSKGAVIQLTRILAAEWAAQGVQVNSIAPGATWTGMTAPAMEDPAIAASIIGRGFSGRISHPEEIAAAVVFLASNAADQIVGQTIFVDGGSTAR
jgi:NAD(P)-dependent dehydrogenase (short-subunit alcohol dehydrogenase family)